MKGQRTQRESRGAVLITFSLAIVVIFGFMGLAFDLGRLYLARNEAQSFCDAAALAGVIMLDGTTTQAAFDAVRGVYMGRTEAWKAYHFENTAFTRPKYTVKFGTSAGGTFQDLGEGAPAPGYRYIEVVATAEIPMYLSQVLTGQTRRAAVARAVAAQELKTMWDEGLIPFAPMAHCSNTGAYGFTRCDNAADLGLVEGQDYTLRWAASGFTQSFNKYDGTVSSIKMSNWCGGDSSDAGWAKSVADAYTAAKTAGGATDDVWEKGRGYWETGQVNNTKDRRLLIYGAMGGPVQLGDDFSGKEPEIVAAIKSTLNDKASSSDPYAYVPIVDPMNGDILGFRTVKLIQSPKYGAGNDYWCAQYVGSTVFGVGTEPAEKNGVYEIRLVR